MLDFEICQMITDEEMDEKGYVHWKSWQETYADLMPEEYLEKITLEKCVEMAHRFPQNTLLIKVDNKTVGFSCVSLGQDVNEVVAIYLLKKYQKKGLGYELLKRTISVFRDNLKIVLWVLAGNDRAISFYRRFGFEFNGTEKTCPFGKELQMEYILQF